jgi:hypothetical protein
MVDPTHTFALHVPPQQSKPCVQAAPAASHVGGGGVLPEQTPPVQSSEQQSLACEHLSPDFSPVHVTAPPASLCGRLDEPSALALPPSLPSDASPKSAPVAALPPQPIEVRKQTTRPTGSTPSGPRQRRPGDFIAQCLSSPRRRARRPKLTLERHTGYLRLRHAKAPVRLGNGPVRRRQDLARRVSNGGPSAWRILANLDWHGSRHGHVKGLRIAPTP